MDVIKSMTTEIAIYRSGTNPIYGEESTRLILTDEAAGAFFLVRQDGGEVRLQLDEIAAIYNHAKKMSQDYEGMDK